MFRVVLVFDVDAGVNAMGNLVHFVRLITVGTDCTVIEGTFCGGGSGSGSGVVRGTS